MYINALFSQTIHLIKYKYRPMCNVLNMHHTNIVLLIVLRTRTLNTYSVLLNTAVEASKQSRIRHAPNQPPVVKNSNNSN